MNEALSAFIEILNKLGIRFVAVGSIASSIHGLPRFTNDADLLVDLGFPDLGALNELAAERFYFDVEEARRSLAASRSFNLIHLASAGKIDPVEMAPRGNSQHIVPLAIRNLCARLIPNQF